MKRLNKLAIVAAAVAAFVASSVWYAVSGNATMELSGTGSDAAATMANPAYTALFVVAQSLVVAFVLSYFVVRLGVAGPKDAVRLGVLAWIFPAMILLGSVVHENVARRNRDFSRQHRELQQLTARRARRERARLQEQRPFHC